MHISQKETQKREYEQKVTPSLLFLCLISLINMA